MEDESKVLGEIEPTQKVKNIIFLIFDDLNFDWKPCLINLPPYLLATTLPLRGIRSSGAGW